MIFLFTIKKIFFYKENSYKDKMTIFMVIYECKIILKQHYFIKYLSQPTLRQEGNVRLMGASSKGGKCVESPPTFIQGKRRKNQKRCGLRTLSEKGLGVVFTHGEDISTPRVCH